MRYCDECRLETSEGHAPWCSVGDPGGRPAAALLWERLEEINDRIDRLALALGLPPDWDEATDGG